MDETTKNPKMTPTRADFMEGQTIAHVYYRNDDDGSEWTILRFSSGREVQVCESIPWVMVERFVS